METAKRYVAYMGGADAILERARADHEGGDDRWVAEVVKHVVFADPDNTAARDLLADALIQLGYQAESGPWRNFYLTGAKELRDGVTVLPTPTTMTSDVIQAMDTGFLAICIRHPDVAELAATVQLVLPDVDESYLLELSSGVLHHRRGPATAAVDATITLPRSQLNALLTSGEPATILTGPDGP